METTVRKIDSDENKLLIVKIDEIKSVLNTGLNWYILSILIGLTIASVLHIYYFHQSNWSLISKFLVCVGPIGLWVMLENHFKRRRVLRNELEDLEVIQTRKHVKILPINIKRVAIFQEYNDEGDLLLIETTEKKCIYINDNEHFLIGENEFPCNKLEIYMENSFKFAINKKAKCLGNKLNPYIISGESKRTYFSKIGLPKDLEIETKTFDSIIIEANGVLSN